jgi:hypothetical protein
LTGFASRSCWSTTPGSAVTAQSTVAATDAQSAHLVPSRSAASHASEIAISETG